jgi:hypothetical protein
MIKRLVIHNIKHISYCATNLVLIAMFAAWTVNATAAELWRNKGNAEFASHPDSLICNFATVTQNGAKVWSSYQKRYVKEAKVRRLSCGVARGNRSSISSSYCSMNNLNACSNDLVCKRGTRLINGKRIWDDRSGGLIKYSVKLKSEVFLVVLYLVAQQLKLLLLLKPLQTAPSVILRDVPIMFYVA